MSKKAKHHKPKGPKSPPQNPIPKDTEEVKNVESENRVPDPKPNIPSPPVEVKVPTNEVKPIEKIEQSSLNPVAETPETPTPVKPKRHRGNRKKKNVGGGAQEVIEEEAKDASANTATTQENVETKQPVVQSPALKICEIQEVKEEVQTSSERSKKTAKQKKGGGNKSEDINQEKIAADSSTTVSKKSDDKVLEKKCDAQTQIERKVPKDVKADEKVKESDCKIISEDNVKKIESDPEPTKPEKAKRQKNKKKEVKEDVQEKTVAVPEEKIKSASEEVILSEAAETVKKEENIPAGLLGEQKGKEKEKTDVKPEPKNKKDKKQKDKEFISKSDETNILPLPVTDSKAEIKSIPSQLIDTSPKMDKDDTKTLEKPKPEDVISQTKSKISIEDDIYPTLASSIEETLQKLIVCESDLIMAEKMYSDDKTLSESIKIEPIASKEVKEDQKIAHHLASKEKGKDKNKKSKKSEKQSDNLPSISDIDIIPEISTLGQSIQPIHQDITGKQNEKKQSEVKPKEDILIASQILQPSQPTLSLQKEPSPVPSPREKLTVSNIQESVDKTMECLEKNFQSLLGGKETEKTLLSCPIIQSSPQSPLNIKKGSSPTIREQLFQPMIEPDIENMDTVKEMICPLAVKVADIKRAPSPKSLPTPEIIPQKEPSRGTALEDQSRLAIKEVQEIKVISEQKTQGLLEFKPIEIKSSVASSTVQSCSPSNLCQQKESCPMMLKEQFPQPAEDSESSAKIKETKKDSEQFISLSSMSSSITDFKKESPPDILREKLLIPIITEEKTEKAETLIDPESCVSENTVSDDIIDILLSDTPPALIDQSSKRAESCKIGNISKGPENLLKFDDQNPIEKQEEKCFLKSTETKLIKTVEESKPTDCIHPEKMDIKKSRSPAKDLQSKVDEGKNTDKIEKHKSQKNKSKNKAETKSSTIVIPEATETTEVSLTLPTDINPDDNIIKIEEDKATELKKKDNASEAFIKCESPVNIPKAAKRAKDKKNRGKVYDGEAETENIPIMSDIPVATIVKDIKDAIIDKQLEDDFKSISSDAKPQLDIEKSEKKEIKLGETLRQSPQLDPTGSTFEFLKIPDDKEEEKISGKEDNKSRPKSPANQSKNLRGPSNSPAKSNKYDYKKEKNKDCKTATSDTIDFIDEPPIETIKEVKSSTPTPKKNNKSKNKASNEQKTSVQEKKDTQPLGVISATAIPQTSSSDLTEDIDEEFVYKYSFRTVFIANACHICKLQLTDDRVVCRFCHLVSYCNENHRDDDWSEHQTLCYAICTLSHVKASEHIYGDAKSLTGQDYRLLRMQAIVSCEKILKRKLCPWEQEVLLYPRICCDPTCREWRSDKLKDCEQCGQVSYCIKNQAHLPQDHSAWCQSYRLYHRLVAHQLHQGRIEPELPTKVYQDGYQLSDDCSKVFEELYGQFKDMDDCHYATLTQLSTAPLTALYAYQKTIGAKDVATDVTKKESSLCLHVIGAELQFEADTLNKWECFFLHLTAGLQELRVVFIGPELNSSKLPVDLLSRIRMCQACRSSNKAVKFEFHDGLLYHDYVESSKFSKPDLICAFNPGFHRATGYAGLDTWPETISASLRLKAPLCVTAYTQYEMPRDLARVRTVFPDVQVKIPPTRNPYASLRPDRNFISDDEMPLIFKNYQMMIVSAI